jgi:hypothetical protein
MPKQRPVRHAGVAKKFFDPIEENAEPIGVEPRRAIAFGEAFAQPIIGLPLEGRFALVPGSENAAIAPIQERERQRAYAANEPEHRRPDLRDSAGLTGR